MILDKIRTLLMPYAPLFVRIGIGLVFLLFSWSKLGLATAAQGRQEIIGLLGLNLGTAAALNYALGVTELMVSLSFITGTFIKYTGLLGAFLISSFFGTLVLKYGINQDATLNRDLGLIGGSLTLWLLGAGPFSVDAWLAKRKQKEQQTSTP